jgi:hypothetical protein
MLTLGDKIIAVRHTQTLYEHIECEKKEDLQGFLLLSINTLHIFLYHCHHKINYNCFVA